MFYEQDWLMQQVTLLVAAIARLVFHKNILAYKQLLPALPAGADRLRQRCQALFAAGKFGQAEDLLYAAMRPGDKDVLLVALDFYEQLAQLGDAALEAGNFPREEIQEGLAGIVKQYGLTVLPGGGQPVVVDLRGEQPR